MNRVFILSGAVFKLFSSINLELKYCQFISNQAQMEGSLLQITSDSFITISYCVINLISQSISFQNGGLLHGDSSNNITLLNIYLRGEVYGEIDGSLLYLGDLNLLNLELVYFNFKVLKTRDSSVQPSLL